MAKAARHIAPDRAEWMSWLEIYEHVHKRNPSAPPQSIQSGIIKAWHDGRLPLIALEEQDYRRHSPLRPLVWRGRPSPDDHDIEVVAGVVFVIPKREEDTEERALWRSGGAYLPASPGDLPTVVKDPVYYKSLIDPPDQLVEVLEDQLIPANISLAAIKFDWAAGTANWRDEKTGAITRFLGIKAKRADADQIWPPIVAETTARWVAKEVKSMRSAREIQPGITRAALARKIKLRLDVAAKAGLVEHTLKQKPLEQALKHWRLWPVAE
jgi:hypothetical protein